MIPVLAIPLTAAGTGLVYLLARMGSYARAGRTQPSSPSSPTIPAPPPGPIAPPDDEPDEPGPTTPTSDDTGPEKEPEEPPPPAPEPPPDDAPDVPTPAPVPTMTLEELVAGFMGAARAAAFMAWLRSTLGERAAQLESQAAQLPVPPSFDATCALLAGVIGQTLTPAEAHELVGKFPEWKPILDKCAIQLRAVPAPDVIDGPVVPPPTPEEPEEPSEPATPPEDVEEEPGPAEEPTEPPPPAPEPPPDDSPELPTPTPEPTPAPGPMPPAGFNWQHAAQLAPAIANNLGERGIEGYDRARLKAWQSLAGIDVDGIYGGETRGALVHFLDASVPKAMFKPTATAPYKWASLVPKGAGLEFSKRGAPPAPTPEDVEADDQADQGDEGGAPPPPAPEPPPDDGAAEVGPVPPEGFDPVKARKMAKQVANNLDTKGRDSYDRKLLRSFQTAAGIDVDGIYGGQSKGALRFYGVKRPPNAFFKPVEEQPYQWAAQANGGAP